MFTFKIAEIEFSGGETIDISQADVVIIVGANNCGKSLALKNINEILENENKKDGLCTKRIKTETYGTNIDISDWLMRYYASPIDETIIASKDGNNRYTKETLKARGFDVALSFSKVLYELVLADNRLSLANHVKRINIVTDNPRSPIHYLQLDKNLLSLVSNEVKQSFGKGIVLFREDSTNIWLNLGEDPLNNEIQDRLSLEYNLAVHKLPRLYEQGHGIRAFVGCLLHVVIGHRKIILIDEPELFLHPPQAKRLGIIMGEQARINSQQIIITTHSAEVIQGVLKANDNVAIIRLNRQENENHAYLLNKDNIQELWRKPQLKSSTAIQGLFHEGVIVCEADADVQFYESLMLSSEETLGKPTDFHFVHSGGKGMLPSLITSYKKLHVPVVAIADIDLLQRESDVRKVVEALEGDFSQIEKLYKTVSKALADKGTTKSVPEIIQEVEAQLEELRKKPSISLGDIETIEDILEAGRTWSEAKRSGISSLDNQDYKDCDSLLDELAKIGLFIVPVGELESWDKAFSPKNKAKWILKALQKIKEDLSSFKEASQFVEKIAQYFW